MKLQERLDRLTAERDHYKYTGEQSMQGKRVLAMLGPSAVGKSTLIQACLNQAPDKHIKSIAEAGTTGTRDPRPGDPESYHMGVPMEEMVEMIEEGRVVNWSPNKTGHIYATLPEDFPAEYNFMACLPDSLPMLRRAGFAVVHAFYIVTSVEAWEKQLETRIYTTETAQLPANQRIYHKEASGRIEEAIDSLEFARANRDSLLEISNTPGEESMSTTAGIILEISKRQSTYSCGTEQMKLEYEKNIREMYSRAVDLSWEIQQAS